MLGGRGDDLVDHLLQPSGVVELAAQLVQEPHRGRGHDHPAPAAHESATGGPSGRPTLGATGPCKRMDGLARFPGAGFTLMVVAP